MPHVTIEYTANLDRDITPAEMMHRVHRAVIETGVFPIQGIKTRLRRLDTFVFGGPEEADAGFIFVVVRMRSGRSPETHKLVTAHLLAALRSCIEEQQVKRPIGLNVEAEEINTNTYSRYSTVFDG